METLQLVCGAEKFWQLPPTKGSAMGMVIYKKVEKIFLVAPTIWARGNLLHTTPFYSVFSVVCVIVFLIMF